MSKQRPDYTTCVVILQMPAELKELLRKMAALHDRSISAEVRWLIKQTYAVEVEQSGVTP